jgi:hypothetical protein
MTIWRMRIACWIPKATNIHSQYIIPTAFPLQQWLHERASMLRYTYNASFVTHSLFSRQTSRRVRTSHTIVTPIYVTDKKNCNCNCVDDINIIVYIHYIIKVLTMYFIENFINMLTEFWATLLYTFISTYIRANNGFTLFL